MLAPELVGARLRHGLGPAVDLSSAGGGPSAHPPADATVAIATRDRVDALERALESVFDGVAAPARVVVVDNAPSDDAARRPGGRASATSRGHYVREDRPAWPAPTTPPCRSSPPRRRLHRRRRGGRPPGGPPVAAFAAGDDVACVTGLIFPAELRPPSSGGSSGPPASPRASSAGSDPGVDGPARPALPVRRRHVRVRRQHGLRTAFLRGPAASTPPSAPAAAPSAATTWPPSTPCWPPATARLRAGRDRLPPPPPRLRRPAPPGLRLRRRAHRVPRLAGGSPSR